MPRSPVRVLFITDGPDSPGSRFRCLQFFPHLEARGIHCEVRFAYDEHYNEVFERVWAPAYKAVGRLRRVSYLLTARGYDLLFLHKTAMPFSSWPERLRKLAKVPVVFDFDDAIYLGRGGADSLLRERAFRGAVASADAVIAGNPHLAKVAAVPEKTTVIPSVVDTATYQPRAWNGGDDLVVGWMGTATNLPFLRTVVPQLLEAVAQLPRARLRIVSNGTLPELLKHPQVEQWRWSADREQMALQSFDIGLMPLPDNEHTRGKCGFKMLQYMATGVPVVASAVGANIGLFEDSRAGHLVPPGGDWVAPIVALGRERASRLAAGAAGRAHVDERYSVRAVLPAYEQLFRRLTGKSA